VTGNSLPVTGYLFCLFFSLLFFNFLLLNKEILYEHNPIYPAPRGPRRFCGGFGGCFVLFTLAGEHAGGFFGHAIYGKRGAGG
jgi:hypothetical protein